jgi:hypothetical protein
MTTEQHHPTVKKKQLLPEPPLAGLKLPLLVLSLLDARDRSVSRLVHDLGFRNISKGCRRVSQWLTAAKPPSEEHVRMLSHLAGIAPGKVIEMIAADLAALEAERRRLRALDPTYRLTLRLIPGFYTLQVLPASLTIEEAIAQAREGAQKLKIRVALNLPDSRTIYFGPSGEIESTSYSEPYMKICGVRCAAEARPAGPTSFSLHLKPLT